MLDNNPIGYSFTLIPKFELINDLILKRYSKKNKLKVLDLCCGTGYLLEYLNQKIDLKEYTGIDIDSSSIRIAKKYFKKKKLKVEKYEFVKKDISLSKKDQLNFKKDKFDLVFFLDGIEHIKQDKKALEFAYKNLHKDGLLILSTPHTKGIFVNNLDTYMHDHGPMNNEREGYAAEEIYSKLNMTKFRNTKIYYTNFFITEIIILFSKLGYRIFNKRYKSQAELFKFSNKNILLNFYIVFVNIFKGLILKIDKVSSYFFKGHCIITISRK